MADECQGCNKEGTEEPHGCPYKEDVNGDYESECNCCEKCEANCAWEI